MSGGGTIEQREYSMRLTGDDYSGVPTLHVRHFLEDNWPFHDPKFKVWPTFGPHGFSDTEVWRIRNYLTLKEDGTRVMVKPVTGLHHVDILCHMVGMNITLAGFPIVPMSKAGSRRMALDYYEAIDPHAIFECHSIEAAKAEVAREYDEPLHPGALGMIARKRASLFCKQAMADGLNVVTDAMIGAKAIEYWDEREFWLAEELIWAETDYRPQTCATLLSTATHAVEEEPCFDDPEALLHPLDEAI